MKPQHLIISAFGPFAGKVEIPFQELGGKGLFLITGDTGAGKTTIFDAISFALFGESSGLVRPVDSLRSDFAQPGVKTYIELRFLHRGEEYTLRRNPKYQRPKKSGEGTTEEPADAVLTDADGSVITGNVRVTESVTKLLGINYKQFKQIAMIAQGEFLKLLLAEHKERAEIFRRVFATDILEKAQQDLKRKEKEARVQFDSSCKAIEQYTGTILYTEEQFMLPFLQEWKTAPNLHRIAEWVDLLKQFLQQDEQVLAEMKACQQQQQKKLSDLIAEHTRAEQNNKTLQELSAAQTEWKQLQEQEPTLMELEQRAQLTALAVERVSPLERIYLAEEENEKQLQKSIEALIQKERDKEKQRSILQANLQKEQSAEPEREALAEQIAQLKALLPDYSRLETLKKEQGDISAQLDTCTRNANNLSKEKETLQQERSGLQAQLENSQNSELHLASVERDKETAAQYRKALLELHKMTVQLEELEKNSVLLQKNYLAAEQAYANQQRLCDEKEQLYFRQQAGVLASQLLDGSSCPVCGSFEHPQKAVLTGGAPSDEELRQLRAERDEAAAQRQEASTQAHTVIVQSQSVRDSLKQKLTELLPELSVEIGLAAVKAGIIEKGKENTKRQERLEEEWKRLTALCENRKIWSQQLTEIEKRLFEIDPVLLRSNEEKSALAASVSAKKAEISLLQEKLPCASEQEGRALLEKAEKELQQSRQALKDSEQALQNCISELSSIRAVQTDTAKRQEEQNNRLGQAKQNYHHAVSENGFASEEKYRLALADREQLEPWRAELRTFDESKRFTQETIRRLTEESKGKIPKDLTELTNQREQLEQKRTELEEAIGQVSLRFRSNTATLGRIETELLRKERLEQEYLVLSTLSKTANGELPGVQKLAFEQYVQASYFRRIIEEANQRLRRMTNNRFELLHKETSSDFRSQSGLDLDVMDYYTGKLRSVRSLSGGESFKASLSLALGLSDVIQSYAGGVQIDTLFIDEGFGSLDSESLEQAIASLIALTEGNRLVGIISHVSELKERIDRKITVQKSVVGSTAVLTKQ